MDDEAQFMRRAIEIAERGRNRVMPNPLVGCVLVKDGKIIAEGWHDHIGGLHAEQMAIADAEAKGVATQGSTAYVTLEPCQMCAGAMYWAQLSRLVFGASDPHRGYRKLNTTLHPKTKVSYGVLSNECKLLIDAFFIKKRKLKKT